LFYTELTRLIGEHDFNASDNDGISNHYTPADKISKNVLISIQQKVLSRLSQYFIYDKDNIDKDDWIGLIFCPDKCTVKYQKIKGYGCSTEDVGAILLLSFTLELTINKSSVLEFMEELSVVINDGLDRTSSESHISAATSKSKIFEMIRKICNASGMERSSVNEGQCFSTLSYILGVVRFLALGMPFYPTLASAFKGSNYFMNYEESNLAEKKSSEADIFDYYLVCCYNVIDGLLKCFMMSLKSVNSHDNNDEVTNHLKQSIMSIQAILDIIFDTTTNTSTAAEIKGYRSLQEYVTNKISSSDISSSLSPSSCIQDNTNIINISLTMAESMIKSSKEKFLETFLSKLSLSSADLSSNIAKSSLESDASSKKSVAYPFSMSIGILGYACYEASLASSSMSSAIEKSKQNFVTGDDESILFYAKNLDKILAEIEDTYSKVAAIAIEDSLLDVAIDQSYKLYHNDIDSGIAPNTMIRKSLRTKTKKRLADSSDCSDSDSDSGTILSLFYNYYYPCYHQNCRT
jgi:hypothetical protein